MILPLLAELSSRETNHATSGQYGSSAIMTVVKEKTLCKKSHYLYHAKYYIPIILSVIRFVICEFFLLSKYNLFFIWCHV